MMPARSHTGTPNIEFDGFLHFTSSTTSGQASLMRLRTLASVSPRQSPSALILASIRWEGEASAFASFEAFFISFFIVFAFFTGGPAFRLGPNVADLQPKLEFVSPFVRRGPQGKSDQGRDGLEHAALK